MLRLRAREGTLRWVDRWLGRWIDERGSDAAGLLDALESQTSSRDLPGLTERERELLRPAASQGERVGAIVCRSARTDLAKFALPDVRSPTLFLAGSDEPSLLELNRAACEELSPPTALERIPGSGRGSAEPKLLDQIAQAASKWYESHLGAPGAEEATLRAR